MTCPGREAMLEQTVASFEATDFSAKDECPFGVAPVIQIDTNQQARLQERQEHNSLSAIQAALNHSASNDDFIIFCEDDIIFNRHLRHNLENWLPLKRIAGTGAFFFASLYDCTIREISRHEEDHYFIADPNAVYGSQCYVFSVSLARYFVAHWWEVQGMQDIKMSRLAATHCPIYYHTPSLVQHVGIASVWGGGFHETRDFDGEFKAEVRSP